MKVQIEKYQRFIILLCLVLFYWILGGFTLSLDLIFTGTLLLIASLSMIWYLPFTWIVSRIYTINTWLNKEVGSASILTAFLFLVAAVEAYSRHFKLSLLFVGGIILIGLFNYFYYQMLDKKIKGLLNTKGEQYRFLPMSIIGMILLMGAVVKYAYSVLPVEDTEIVLFENSDPQMEIIILAFFCEIFLLAIFSIYAFLRNRKGNKERPTLGWISKVFIGMTILLIGTISTGEEVLIEIAIPFYILMLFALGIYWLIKQIKLIINLKKEQTKTELLHLKSQVNPHFFFNTLNNLYGLVEKDSKKARTLILKLSDMMRYSIYEGQKEEVPLEEEISYLKNYIELHQMRYHKEIQVDFNAQIQNGDYKVMPLLFIILLENAFKHGVENLIHDSFVEVNIEAKQDEIYFEVVNNFENASPQTPSGIGLKNLKRRLELMYQNRHTLSFSIVNDVYKAQLSIKQ